MKISKDIKGTFEQLKQDYFYHEWVDDFQSSAITSGIDSLITSNYTTNDDHKQSLQPQDLRLFELRSAFLMRILRYTLKTPKGEDLILHHPNDPIQIWHLLKQHHKGSDWALEAASDLLLHLFKLRSSKFTSKMSFLSE